MTLVRKKNRSVTYYRVVLYPTLFNDFLLVHYCGRHGTRTSKKSYYKTKKEALIGSLNVLSAKKAEGFEPLER